MLLWTVCRKREVTEMRWSEYDPATRLWTIPEERTKNGRTHLVPLPEQASKALEHLRTISCGSEWVFPGNRSTKPLGETTLNERLSRSGRLGIDHWTIHDLRRTGSTMLHEMGFPPHVIERALNHVQIGVGGIYNKAQWFEERGSMLQHWADYLDSLENGAEILPFRNKAG